MSDFIDNVNPQTADAVASKIMVIGVGGGGSNAVRYMYNLGIHNVLFMVCNTDKQALDKNPVPLKMQIGRDLTGGLGAGNMPEKGRAAAEESRDDIRQKLEESGVKMVFITAGMGGGTGTGAAPVIAEVAREMNILTIAIVTVPFRYEGDRRINQAIQGIAEMRKHVDSLLIIDNENINLIYGDLTFSEAFGKADDILATAAKSIAEIITKEHKLNVDFADVETTMSNSGVALMGFATATVGIDNIATTLTEEALLSPLLSQNNINGAKNLLVNISWKDKELKMSEVYAIIGHVQAAAGDSASLIWGAGYDETLEDGKVSVVIVATGFEQRNMQGECEKDMWLENIMVKPKEEPGDETPAPEVVIDNTPAVQPANIVTPTPERPAEQPTAPQKVVVSWDDTPVDEGKESQEPDDDDFALVDDLQRAHNEIYREKMAASVSPMANKNVGNGERTFLSLDDEDVKEEPKKSNDDDMLSMEVKNMPIGSTSPMGMPAGFSPDNASQEQTSVRRNLFSEQQIDAPAPDMRRSSPEPFRRHVNDPFDMEQMENTPAYLRRNMLITPNPSAKKKVEKLNIKDEDL